MCTDILVVRSSSRVCAAACLISAVVSCRLQVLVFEDWSIPKVVVVHPV